MNIRKNLLLGLGGLATISLVTASVVSCSSTEFVWPKDAPNEIESQTITVKTNKDYATTTISGASAYSKKFETVIPKLKDKIKQQRVKLITAGGVVTDNSFNQSVWEGISIFGNQTENGEHAYAETTKDSQLQEAYTATLNAAKPFGIWVLTGFQQGAAFDSWLQAGDNFTKFVKSGAIVVGVDWTPTEAEKVSKLCFDNGRIISLNFQAREASYVVGKAAASYLAATYSGEANKDKRSVTSFGGGVFAGVTSFNNGFLQAIVDHNKAQTSNNTKIQFFSGEEGDKTIMLNTGFDSTTSQAKTAIDASVGTKAQIFFPVAGSLTDSLLGKIDGSERMLIGVDSDYKLAKPNNNKNIFSSVLKRVGVAVYQSLLEIMLPEAFAEAKETNILDSFVFGKKSVNALGGYEASFVATANNANTTEATKINKYLNDAFEATYGTNGKKPEYTKDMINNPNNNQDELNELVVEINAWTKK